MGLENTLGKNTGLEKQKQQQRASEGLQCTNAHPCSGAWCVERSLANATEEFNEKLFVGEKNI
jgi:hypothetical protein